MAPPKLPLLNPTNTTEPQLPRYIVDYLKALDQWAQRIDSQVVRYGVNPPAGGEEIFGQVLRTTRILPPKIQSGIPTVPCLVCAMQGKVPEQTVAQ